MDAADDQGRDPATPGGRPEPAGPPQDRDRQPVDMRKPVAEAELRASDADRDRIAGILREALAEGRLDAEEHAERIDAVYRAKTMGELEPVVRDLPVALQPAAPGSYDRARSAPAGYDTAPVPDQNLVAIFSASTRSGRWRVPARINAVAIFGSVEIDLSEAVFPQQQVRINATSVFGSVEIRVPENVTLRSSGSGVLGNFEVATNDAVEADAPVVLVNGYAVLGSVEARPKRGAWIRDLRDRIRAEWQGREERLRGERSEGGGALGPGGDPRGDRFRKQRDD